MFTHTECILWSSVESVLCVRDHSRCLDISACKTDKKSQASWYLHSTRQQKIKNSKLNRCVDYIICWKMIRAMGRKKKKKTKAKQGAWERVWRVADWNFKKSEWDLSKHMKLLRKLAVQTCRGAHLRHGEQGVQRPWGRKISRVFEE